VQYVSLEDELSSSFQILEEDCLGRHSSLRRQSVSRCCRLDETIGVQVGVSTGDRYEIKIH